MAADEVFRASRDRLIELREDHRRASAEFVWPDTGPAFNWAVDWFDRIALGNERTALWIVEEDGSEERVSFDRMRQRSDRVGGWLAAQGVRPGDHVMLMLGNQVELWESMLAVMKIGAVILPTTTVLAAHDLADRVDRGLVRHVIANAADADKFAELDGFTRIAVGGAPAGWLDYGDAAASADPLPEVAVRSDEPCLVYFTSGTTSRPKMVVHTRTSYPVGHLTTMYWIGLRPGDVHLAISSPGWAKHAWSCFFAPWNAEATVFVSNYRRFDAVALRAQLDRAGVTTFCAPPTVWRMLIQAELGARPTALREALSAGEPLNPEVIERVRDAWGLTIRDGYGQTETTATIANTPGSPVRSGSMGVPLPGVAITLIDPITGEEADEGEISLDLAQGAPFLMAGYLGVPGTGAATGSRFYGTGDVAQRDGDGVITFIGRTDDIFKSSDYKVSPFEVESVLIEHPAVAEAAVVPAPHPTRLNLVKAYVALANGWSADRDTAFAVLRHAREQLPPYERVRRIEFFELPKTISGKIRRVELRQREADAAAAGERLADEWRDDQFPELKGRG
ncbi:AMP-binding protein [Amnibacterium kyonggiense]|uniref:Acetyl-CoA synthetase n=1 Tax=Amnibacterium kyonggiense TaxID=595671 RepID=A0A4R7FFD2_9MICO|nr:AMP-binding protein [Amnibacterium kyonggiense]TDS76093.1 acetyl-CoA synthetase [Amnibacterium kyonggiense]